MMRDVGPPVILTRFVKMLASGEDAEIILGDLHELYVERQARRGRLFANAAYVADIFTMIRNRAFRRARRSQTFKPFVMIGNYLTTAVRQLKRQKTHNAINIAGLSLGVAVTLVIGLFIQQELSFDRFHEKGDRIYLLPMTWTMGKIPVPVAEATSASGPFMKDAFPQVEAMTRLRAGSLVFNLHGDVIEEREVYHADSTFFEVFTFPLVAGNPRHALVEPLSVVLTEQTAERYFGPGWRTDILSRVIIGQDKRNYRVTGVVKNPPLNSHIRFDLLVSMSSTPGEREGNYDNSSYLTYLVLHPEARHEEIVTMIPATLEAKAGKWASDNIRFDLLPLHDVHLRNPNYPGIASSSDIRYVYVFSAVAIMVLLIAIINYMNLSTARSLERAREVGVRKAMGAVRAQLFSQFLGESMIVSLIAMAMAVLLAIIFLPLFTAVSGKELDVNVARHPEWIVYILSLWIFISLLGGSYPALVLSAHRPAHVLKGKLMSSLRGLTLRRVLVVAQFTSSILLVICTMMIQRQLGFMMSADVGIDKERMLSFQLDSISRLNLPVLRKEFVSTAGVENVAATILVPVDVTMRSGVWAEGVQERQIIGLLGTDPEFVATAGLTLMAGTNFSFNVEADSEWEFLLNESAVKFFGWSNDSALGKQLSVWGSGGVVKGVVKDFHFASLHKPIQPLILSAGSKVKNSFNFLIVRTSATDYATLISALETKWKQITPGSAYSFSFVDDRYNDLYLTEVRLSRIMDVFCLLAIFIACLGLFGLASYTIVQRTRELGIRKVLGASVSSLMVTVSGNLLLLIVLSFAISLPFSWYIMRQWLQNFHYHVDFDLWIALAVGVASVLIAAITVAYHSLEAARVNPVESLRAE